MLNWLKQLLGLQPSPQDPAAPDLVLDPEPGTVEALDAENIELGRQADALRERRIANRKLAALLRDGSN